MFKEFETLDFALREFSDNYNINVLWYDDLKRKIVINEPNHQNKILLIERGQPINIAIAKDITKRIAKHHKDQYIEVIQAQAAENPIPYDELFKYLNEGLHIFYDAAKELDNQILHKPHEFGLKKMMHWQKSLCFIPI